MSNILIESFLCYMAFFFYPQSPETYTCVREDDVDEAKYWQEERCKDKGDEFLPGWPGEQELHLITVPQVGQVLLCVRVRYKLMTHEALKYEQVLQCDIN